MSLILEDTFEGLYNPQLIRVERLTSDEDVQAIKKLIYKHLEATDSGRGKEILTDWGKICRQILEDRSAASGGGKDRSHG